MINPPGLAPTRVFVAFLFIYVDLVACCASGFSGFVMGHSDPSIIRRLCGNDFFKPSGAKNLTVIGPQVNLTPLKVYKVYPSVEYISYNAFLYTQFDKQLIFYAFI